MLPSSLVVAPDRSYWDAVAAVVIPGTQRRREEMEK
jgi:hypothetical protein